MGGDAVEADGGEEEQGHEEPGGERDEACGGVVCEEEGDGGEVGDGEAEERADEEERGVVELGEGGAGDHVADFGEGGVGAEAAAFAREAHPDFWRSGADFGGEVLARLRRNFLRHGRGRSRR